MITSFVQYILMAPSYINVLNVYAVCITFPLLVRVGLPDVYLVY